MFLLLLLVLFTTLEALKLPFDNNIIKNIGEVNLSVSSEIMYTTLPTRETTVLSDETEAKEIIDETSKNETKKDNETRKEKYNDETRENGENEAKETTETMEPENSIKNESNTISMPSTTTNSPSTRCLNVECPMAFPYDCPEDSVPILSFTAIDNSSLIEENCCAPTRVECKCDLQKCFVPACPEGTELSHILSGISSKPGQCCDQFECRPIELNCQNIHCPDTSSLILDLYSPDGKTCPEDSYRPKSYIPTGGCCPIMPQCQCKLSICEPALCLPEQQLLIIKRGRGEPGQCCDKFKCVNDGDEMEGELFLDENGSNTGCRHEDHIYAKGEHWNVAPCQECECSAAGVALCKRMECSILSSDCQWVGLSPGECCPVCLGCSDDNGKNYLPGEHWDRDGCTNCTCGGENFDFHWQCQKFICQTECEWPRPPIGSECCPVCEDGPTIALGQSFFSSCPSLNDCELLCPFGLYQNNSTGCFECKCIEEENIIKIEENKQKIMLKEEKDEKQKNVTTIECQPSPKENCLYNEHAYEVGEHFQDGPFRNCSCLSGGMLKCIEVHCPPCSSFQPFISAKSNLNSDETIETTTETVTSGNWCLQQCLQQQEKNNKEQEQFNAFEQGGEQILIFENRQPNNFTATSNNTKHLQQQKWSQPHWLFILAALIVGIPAFTLLLLFVIYLLLVAFNSKYRKCRKERNIEQASTNQFINNKWRFSQLLPRIKQQNKQNNNKNKNSTNIASNSDLVVKVSLLGINKNNKENVDEN